MTNFEKLQARVKQLDKLFPEYSHAAGLKGIVRWYNNSYNGETK